MIKTREDLHFYLQEDAKCNGFGKGELHYLICLLANRENALAYQYLKSLRRCEYHYNQNTLPHKLAFYFYKFKRTRLGGKYSIQIPLNKTGYGLRILHLSGGGGHFVECQ